MTPMIPVTRLHVMMVMMDRPFTDDVPIFIRIDVAVMMVIMDHVGVTVAINLRHTIFVVVSHGSCVRGQDQRRRTEESKHLFHSQLGVCRLGVIQWSLQRFPVCTGDDVVRILRKHGFSQVGQKGIHQKWRHANRRQVIVAMHGNKLIPVGTLKSVLPETIE